MTLMSLKKCCIHCIFTSFLADNREEYLLQARLFFHVLHFCRREQFFQICKRAIGDDFAFMQNGNSIRELLGFIQILRGQEYRRAAVGKLFDGFPNLEARFGVKPGRWFVEENDLRFPDQAHGDVKPAAHTA